MTAKKNDKSEAHYHKAKKLYKSGKINDALAELHLALRIKKNLIPAHVLLSEILSANGDYVNAEKELTACLAITEQQRKPQKILVSESEKYSIQEITEKLDELRNQINNNNV
jgi:tetratricopeptide (TPR) repeat protein